MPESSPHRLPPPRAWGLFALLLVADTAAQLLFKIGATRGGQFSLASLPAVAGQIVALAANHYVLAGASCLVAAFLIWLAIIAVVDLSEAHPVSCLVYGTVALASAAFLGESLDGLQAVGIALIVVGAFATSEP